MAGKQQAAAIDEVLARLAARSDDAHREALAASPVFMTVKGLVTEVDGR